MSIIEDDSIQEMVLDQARRSAAAEVATKFLNGHRFKQSIRFTDGEIQDNLELSCFTLPSSIQEILNNYQSDSELTLKTPSPATLPITVSPICNNKSAIIIPNLKLDVHSLVSDHVQYELEGVLCRLNQVDVVFVRHGPSNEWYYNQDKHPLKKAAPELSHKINQIISSKSIEDSLALLDSVYFIISPIFFNAVRYFYKRL